MESFVKSKILCIGDIILDSYVQGKVERISPEAPIPVFKLGNEKFVLGGAANVARNICAGGGSCYLISVVGKDEDSEILDKLIKQERNLSVKLLRIKNRKTTKKQRYISGQQQVLRIDNETNEEISLQHEKIIF
jgi:rfaE bifunctional protein kinase chain/domain